MKTFFCMQGSPEWLDLRAGRLTASRMGEIITDKRQQFSDAGARTLAAELVAERLIGGVDPWKMQGETVDMRRGLYCENEARSFVKITRNTEIEQVGFCLHANDRWGASVDGLIGDNEILELKCPAPKTQIKWLLNGGVPPEHLAQLHGGMIVTGRTLATFLSYCVGLPPLEVQVQSGDYTATLEAACEKFNGIFDDMLATIIAKRDSAISDAIDRKGDQLPADLRSFVPA